MVALSRFAAGIAVFLPLALCTPQPASNNLFARQVSVLETDPSKVSAECQLDQCLAFVDSVSKTGCIAVECLCQDSIAAGMLACMQCERDNGVPGYDQNSSDETMKIFADACNAAELPVSAGKNGTDGNNSPGGSDSSHNPPPMTDTNSGKTSSGMLSSAVNVLGLLAAAIMVVATLP